MSEHYKGVFAVSLDCAFLLYGTTNMEELYEFDTEDGMPDIEGLHNGRIYVWEGTREEDEEWFGDTQYWSGKWRNLTDKEWAELRERSEVLPQ